MRSPWYRQPLGVWLGLIVIGLGAWAQDVFGVVLGGILAIVTLITTDRRDEKPEDAEADDIAQDERFKDL